MYVCMHVFWVFTPTLLLKTFLLWNLLFDFNTLLALEFDKLINLFTRYVLFCLAIYCSIAFDFLFHINITLVCVSKVS